MICIGLMYTNDTSSYTLVLHKQRIHIYKLFIVCIVYYVCSLSFVRLCCSYVLCVVFLILFDRCFVCMERHFSYKAHI